MPSHAALVAGTVALSLLRASRFRVEAGFARSFYLRPEPPHGHDAAEGADRAQAVPAPVLAPIPVLLCCGQAELVPGPLMLLCATWPEAVSVPPQGTLVQRRGRALCWGTNSIGLEGLRPWTPRALSRHGWGAHFFPPDMGARVAVFLRRCSVPEEGLAPLLNGEGGSNLSAAVRSPQTALLVRAARGLEALRRWLGPDGGPEAGEDAGTVVEALLGLGPGLTPSGDDALAGMLLAMHALGRGTEHKLLALHVSRRLGRTNGISAAHLAAAMHGQGAAVLHALLYALLRLPLRELERRGAGLGRQLGRMGHTSGWDAATGLLATLHACGTEGGSE